RRAGTCSPASPSPTGRRTWCWTCSPLGTLRSSRACSPPAAICWWRAPPPIIWTSCARRRSEERRVGKEGGKGKEADVETGGEAVAVELRKTRAWHED